MISRKLPANSTPSGSSLHVGRTAAWAGSEASRVVPCKSLRWTAFRRLSQAPGRDSGSIGDLPVSRLPAAGTRPAPRLPNRLSTLKPLAAIPRSPLLTPRGRRGTSVGTVRRTRIALRGHTIASRPRSQRVLSILLGLLHGQTRRRLNRPDAVSIQAERKTTGNRRYLRTAEHRRYNGGRTGTGRITFDEERIPGRPDLLN